MVTAMVLCVGESGATTTITPGVNWITDAYSCEVVSCTGITNFTSTSTTVTGCSSNGVDVCIKARTSNTIGASSYTYHKIRTCTRPGVADCSAQFKYLTITYRCPDSSGISPNFCTCAGAGGECETNDDCSPDWGNTQGTLSMPSGYQVRAEVGCNYGCSCNDHGLYVYRCASTRYGTADCILQANTQILDGISRPAGIYCSGCTECPNNGTCTAGNGTTPSCNAGYYRYSDDTSYLCGRCPAIIDSATGRNIYTNSGLSTPAYGASSAGSTSISRCYWNAGTYYDTTGAIEINSGTSYTSCGYSD
ncbi:MAG: hypothetical protein IJE82_04105 [Alphaproteobacteria bacterium]|nr:hypothetical protein [Alphaproteobacteria bacterium]